MKTAVCLLLFTVSTITAGPLHEYISVGNYPRFVEIPDHNGVMHLADLEAEPNAEVLEKIERNPQNNEYHLFTRRNPTASQRLLENSNSIFVSNFNPRNPTVVSVHGWHGNMNTRCNIVIRDAFLNKADINVIILDWRELASANYPTAVAGIPAVGRGLGHFLGFLSGVTGAPLSSFHLVGFSLGAHVVGNAGKQLNGRAARVTGLDPAGPLWDLNANRLSSGDGMYVEAIHTDASPSGVGIGFLTTVGDADFFPNGGKLQPGCTMSHCHHSRAWELFAASVTHDHLLGRQCGSITEVINDNCLGEFFNMGNSDLNKWGSGIFRVTTGSEYPF